jgi:hypothetical protein
MPTAGREREGSPSRLSRIRAAGPLERLPEDQPVEEAHVFACTCHVDAKNVYQCDKRCANLRVRLAATHRGKSEDEALAAREAGARGLACRCGHVMTCTVCWACEACCTCVRKSAR